MNERKWEFLSAAQAILWGIWIGNPWWNSFTVSQAYTWMNLMAPEWLWGWCILLIGLIQLGAVLWRRSITLRSTIALLGIFVWLLVAIAFALGNWRSTAALNSAFFALVEAFTYFNLEIWRRVRNKINEH